jgi:hypothetical protein
MVNIIDPSMNTSSPTLFKQNDFIQWTGQTTINSSSSLLNQKEWTIYQVINVEKEQQIFINNNPTINYADLVLQPQTLSYGLYRIVFTVTMIATDCSASSFTYIRIIPSGLVLSSLKLSQPMYGGTIEITRCQKQIIQFDPYLFTYDIDNVVVITSLTFKYACQLIESNIPQGYPLQPDTNETIYLDDFKYNAFISVLNPCFNSTGKLFFIHLITTFSGQLFTQI